MVESIVLMRKNEQTLPALLDVEEKVEDLNDPATGRLLPGVKIEPYYDRSDLMAITTETVRENLILGMSLVSLILLIFLSNVRSALIVAINIPLALLFAFSALYLRGMSANLLSIGAVDFGIIVDSSVIMVENIYRHLSTGEYAELTLKEQICEPRTRSSGACSLRRRSWSAPSCRCSPCRGPRGRFSDRWPTPTRFALGGALVLALTLAPVLCLLSFKNLQPTPDNWLVRRLKKGYLRNLQTLPPVPLGDGWGDGHPDHRDRAAASFSGPGVHAGPGGGKHLDPGDRCAEYFAGTPQRALGAGPGRLSPPIPRWNRS